MGRFMWDAGDEDVRDGFQPLTPGEYDLKITEAETGTSKGGIPQATVNFVVVNSMENEGKAVRFHRVTFIPSDGKGAWIAKAFLKAIGQPYKGDKVVVDTAAWIGKIIHASVDVEDYNGKKYNKVNNVTAYDGPAIAEKSDEEIPF